MTLTTRAILAAGLWACVLCGGVFSCVPMTGGQPGPEPGDEADAGAGGGGTAFVVFEDPDSDFATTDVVDIDREVVRFDADTDQLVWVASDSRFDGWNVFGNLLGGGGFSVRFGTEDGERKAFFTETGPGTICDLFLQDEDLRIVPTDVSVPQE